MPPKSKPSVSGTQHRSSSSDSEVFDDDGVDNSGFNEFEEEGEMDVVGDSAPSRTPIFDSVGKSKSRAKPYTVSKHVLEDVGSLKLSVLDTVYHHKAYLRSSVINGCLKIVDEWKEDKVPAAFVRYDMTGQKLYKVYNKIMNQVKELKESGQEVPRDKVTRKMTPQYLEYAFDILDEVRARKEKKRQEQEAKAEQQLPIPNA